MAGVQHNASLPHRAAPGGGADSSDSSGTAGGASPAGASGTSSRVPEHLTYSATEDPADYIDDNVVASSRWMDTEIAVGSIVAILVVAALVAVWLSCRRRRRRASPTPEATETTSTAERMRSTLQDVTEIQRKISSMKPLPLQLSNGKDSKDSKNGNGVSNGSPNSPNSPVLPVPVATIVLPPSTPSPLPSPLPDPTVAQVTPWEPYFLSAPGKHGKPGKPVRARRRSVSLRSADDDVVSDDANSVSSRGPSPSPSLNPNATEDGEATRKRSVTFNAMVEEVQILVR
ncbi:uncharacterized protein LOC117641731 isoform X2 [Thrips palmi]|uniref:Uncharacterized protein LOC117641731 isoform X2 n=1 Tax=Thrips palmi TaxID=161013 RepID=A0A6P8YMG1_THRPL|nr:uncharacterized protein LOC117641731 isoform X2 [Thrips palmi]